MRTVPHRHQLSPRHIPFHTLTYITKHGQLSQHGLHELAYTTAHLETHTSTTNHSNRSRHATPTAQGCSGGRRSASPPGKDYTSRTGSVVTGQESNWYKSGQQRRHACATIANTERGRQLHTCMPHAIHLPAWARWAKGKLTTGTTRAAHIIQPPSSALGSAAQHTYVTCCTQHPPWLEVLLQHQCPPHPVTSTGASRACLPVQPTPSPEGNPAACTSELALGSGRAHQQARADRTPTVTAHASVLQPHAMGVHACHQRQICQLPYKRQLGFATRPNGTPAAPYIHRTLPRQGTMPSARIQLRGAWAPGTFNPCISACRVYWSHTLRAPRPCR